MRSPLGCYLYLFETSQNISKIKAFLGVGWGWVGVGVGWGLTAALISCVLLFGVVYWSWQPMIFQRSTSLLCHGTRSLSEYHLPPFCVDGYHGVFMHSNINLNLKWKWHEHRRVYVLWSKITPCTVTKVWCDYCANIPPKQATYNVYRTFRLFTRHADIDAVHLPTYLLNRRLVQVVKFNFLMRVICFFVISHM